jgi:hypothetical protein
MQYGNIFANILAVFIGTAVLAGVFFVAAELSRPKTNMAMTGLLAQPADPCSVDCSPILPATVDLTVISQ